MTVIKLKFAPPTFISSQILIYQIIHTQPYSLFVLPENRNRDSLKLGKRLVQLHINCSLVFG